MGGHMEFWRCILASFACFYIYFLFKAEHGIDWSNDRFKDEVQ